MRLNVSIDDVSPHPRSSTKVLDQCRRVIDEFPEVVFTLFVPTSYWRTVKQGTTTQTPLRLDEHRDFCEILRGLSPKNFEIGYHGFYHGIPGKSDNDEFQHLTQEEATDKFIAMKSMVSSIHLSEIFKPIFRPPAWRMSPGSIIAARSAGYEVLALSPIEYALKTYEGEQTKKDDVVYCTHNPPFIPLPSQIEKDVFSCFVYHACEWDKNNMDEEKTQELLYFLRVNSGNIKFTSMLEEVRSR